MKVLITPDIVYEVGNPTALTISPDGLKVVYGISCPSRESHKYTNTLWIVDLDSNNESKVTPRQLTRGDSDGSPRFSPDGDAVAFLRDDSRGKKQIWVLRMSGGEAGVVTCIPGGIRDFVWKPDSSGFAAVADVDTDYYGEVCDTEISVVQVSRIRFRHDELGWRGNGSTQIFSIDLRSGVGEQLTDEDGDQGIPAWSPDGSKLAYVSDAIPRRDICEGNEVRVLDVESGGNACWSKGLADICSITWLPDGERLAVVASDDARVHSYYQGSIYIISSHSDPIRVTDDDVAPIGGSHPAKSGPTIVIDEEEHISFPGQSNGNSHIFQARIGEYGQRKLKDIGAQIAACDFDGGDGLVSIYSTPDRPAELFHGHISNGAMQKITDLSSDYCSGRPVAQQERFSMSRSGLEIESMLLFPPDFDPSKKYPLVLNIHGGPHGLFANSFDITRQVLASRGYIVLAVNPRGTSTYGRDYMLPVLEDWGGQDYNDIMASIDLVCERPYVDSERLGVTGYSYGGYMSTWIVGHSDRFKSAVVGAPVTNLSSFYGTSDIGVHFGERQIGGPRYMIKEEYDYRSPITYATRVSSPVLLLHGESDLRCPISQSEEYFVTLRRLGKVVEFVRFPGQNHGFLRTGNLKMRKEYLTRMLAWLDCYI